MEKKQEQEISERLTAAIKAVIHQQMDEKDPIETLLTYERLQEDGFSEEDAFSLIGKAISREIAEVIVLEQPLNMERYRKALSDLPEPFSKSKVSDSEED